MCAVATAHRGERRFCAACVPLKCTVPIPEFEQDPKAVHQQLQRLGDIVSSQRSVRDSTIAEMPDVSTVRLGTARQWLELPSTSRCRNLHPKNREAMPDSARWALEWVQTCAAYLDIKFPPAVRPTCIPFARRWLVHLSPEARAQDAAAISGAKVPTKPARSRTRAPTQTQRACRSDSEGTSWNGLGYRFACK